jgi:retron-type reverse transcriptase
MAGVDGKTVQELPGWLRDHWPEVKDQLLTGAYRPMPVKRVEIPKPGGGTRLLGIPTVLDRLLQQALLQVTLEKKVSRVQLSCEQGSDYSHRS